MESHFLDIFPVTVNTSICIFVYTFIVLGNVYVNVYMCSFVSLCFDLRQREGTTTVIITLIH